MLIENLSQASIDRLHEINAIRNELIEKTEELIDGDIVEIFAVGSPVNGLAKSTSDIDILFVRRPLGNNIEEDLARRKRSEKMLEITIFKVTGRIRSTNYESKQPKNRSKTMHLLDRVAPYDYTSDEEGLVFEGNNMLRLWSADGNPSVDITKKDQRQRHLELDKFVRSLGE